MEKQDFESTRMCDERADDVQAFQSGSSLVAVPMAGRVENEEEDDGQGLTMDNPQVVVAPEFPVDTLLEEIGLKIFEMLSYEDVASCFRAYPKWGSWLLHQRTRFLFPEIAPFLLKYLPKASLLECRRVCRTWKDGLDNAYQFHRQHLQVDSENRLSKDSQIPELTNCLDSTDKITSFLQDMESHPGSPFPGRKLVLKWNFPERLVAEQNDDDDEYFYSLFQDYWNNSVIQLLRVFGHQVHFVCLNFEWLEWFEQFIGLEIINNMNVPQILTRCIEQMSNLKKLEIRGEIFNFNSRDRAKWVEDEMRWVTIRLAQLANLETVAITGPRNELISSILESCCVPSKIKRLDLHLMSSRSANAVYGFQNLEVLDVQISFSDLERFRTLERRPPLRKVVLRFYYQDVVDWRRFTGFQQLFTILEVFAVTLKDVQLKSRNRSEEEGLTLSNDRKGFRINLPNLERLSWEYYVGPLDPFIQLPALRQLDFKVYKMLPWEGSAVQLFIWV